jgi:hypothetical protein
MWRVLLTAFCVVCSIQAYELYPLTCRSQDSAYKHCDSDTSHGVKLSTTWAGSKPCRPGYSWGFDESGVWVDHGCSAQFVSGDGRAAYILPGTTASSNSSGHDRASRKSSKPPCTAENSAGLDDHGNWSGPDCATSDPVAQMMGKSDLSSGLAEDDALSASPAGTISCSSDDGRRQHCDINTASGVHLVRQRSSSRCTQGFSWGTDLDGIWVDHGCRADFAINRSGSHSSTGAYGPTCSQSVGDDQARRMVNHCLAVSTGTHPPCNATNSCQLLIDEIKRGCAVAGTSAPAFCDAYR